MSFTESPPVERQWNGDRYFSSASVARHEKARECGPAARPRLPAAARGASGGLDGVGVSPSRSGGGRCGNAPWSWRSKGIGVERPGASRPMLSQGIVGQTRERPLRPGQRRLPALAGCALVEDGGGAASSGSSPFCPCGRAISSGAWGSPQRRSRAGNTGEQGAQAGIVPRALLERGERRLRLVLPGKGRRSGRGEGERLARGLRVAELGGDQAEVVLDLGVAGQLGGAVLVAGGSAPV